MLEYNEMLGKNGAYNFFKQESDQILFKCTLHSMHPSTRNSGIETAVPF